MLFFKISLAAFEQLGLLKIWMMNDLSHPFIAVYRDLKKKFSLPIFVKESVNIFPPQFGIFCFHLCKEFLRNAERNAKKYIIFCFQGQTPIQEGPCENLKDPQNFLKSKKGASYLHLISKFILNISILVLY